jgi:hypothetical protein
MNCRIVRSYLKLLLPGYANLELVLSSPDLLDL